MIYLLKHSIFQFVDKLGVNHLYFKQKYPSVTILTYHSVVSNTAPIMDYEYRNCVTVRAFDKQLTWIKQNFKVISMGEAIERIKENKLNDNYLVITFDDGYENNYKYAVPILQRHHLQATFYITTGLIDTDDCLWTDWITFILLHTHHKYLEFTLEGEKIQLNLKSSEQRIQSSIHIRNWLKSLPKEKEEIVLQQLREISGVDVTPVEVNPERYKFMQWHQVEEMQEAGMEIGSHTHTHALLNMLSDAEVMEELRISKESIEKHLNHPCVLFAYPNGREKDFKETHISILQNLGYHSAVTQIHGYNQGGSDLFRLKRINISHKMSIPVFKAYVCGTLA